jgi:hypothetical protein
MTQKQKIEQLEKEVAELKMKVALLEARPMIITVPQQPTFVPQPGPWAPPSYPYIGTPVLPWTTCDAQHHQNTAGSGASLSSQQTSFLQ